MTHLAPVARVLPTRHWLVVVAATLVCACSANADAPREVQQSAHAVAGKTFPAPAADIPLAAAPGKESIAVFAGGCFWGVEGVFEHVKGVTHVESGYSGGSAGNADYGSVSSGTTRHAESVLVTFDPAQVSYGTLLQVFFGVAHDPTQHNRQGPDIGPQYRSELFVRDAEQARIAHAYIAQLDAAKVFSQPIATAVSTFQAFYPAEKHHQDYMRRNPRDAYIVYNDAPKLTALQRRLPQLYRAAWSD